MKFGAIVRPSRRIDEVGFSIWRHIFKTSWRQISSWSIIHTYLTLFYRWYPTEWQGRVRRGWWSGQTHVSTESRLIGQLFDAVLLQGWTTATSSVGSTTSHLRVGGGAGDRACLSTRRRPVFLLHRLRLQEHVGTHCCDHCLRNESV